MSSLQGCSIIEDFFRYSISNIIEMYRNDSPKASDDENIIISDSPIRDAVLVYHYIMTINDHKIYMDVYGNLYEYKKTRILFLNIDKMKYICSKPDFMDDIALSYKTDNIYEYIMDERKKYLEKKRLDDIFRIK